jgi:hypothetical protein
MSGEPARASYQDLAERIGAAVARAVSAALADELAALDRSRTVPPPSSDPLPAALAQLPPVFTFADLQRVVPLGRTRLWEAVRTGEIPSRQVGRRRLFTREAVAAWLVGNTELRPGVAEPPVPLTRRSGR